MNGCKVKYFLSTAVAAMFFCSALYADTNFEELDKAPEGAYKGQMTAGILVSMGLPQGSMIDAEQSFIKNSTYTFPNNETTKEIWISHLSYSIGAFFEYMPFNYFGLFTKTAYSAINQRTSFGKDYANSSGTLYYDISLLIGPVLHATNRKPWDISLTPLFGYTYGVYTAAPIARKLVTTEGGSTFSPAAYKGKAGWLAYGTDISASVFFSGGLYLSLTAEWVRNSITLAKPVDQANIQTGAIYLSGKTSGYIDNFRIILSSGYAFSN